MLKKLSAFIQRKASVFNRDSLFSGELVRVIASDPDCVCNDEAFAGEARPETFDTCKGPLSEPQPHPHPLFRDRLQVRSQDFMQVQVCQHCGAVSVARGRNFVEVEAKQADEKKTNA